MKEQKLAVADVNEVGDSPATPMFPGDTKAGARQAWSVVFASALALVVSAGTLNLYINSLFLVPVTTELGIARGTFSAGTMICQTVSALCCLVVGVLIDRVGARRVLLFGIPLYAMAIAMFSQMTAPIYVVLGLFAVAGMFSPTHSPLTFGSILTKWFSRKFGFALGVALIGSGLGTTLLPPLLNWLFEHHGWRTAYVALGLIILIVSWVPTFLFVREPPESLRPKRQAAATATYVRSRHFWWLVAAFLLGVPPVGGTLAHIPALLTDRGIDSSTAALALSVAGIFLIFGRLISGWLLDRCFAPFLTAVIFAMPIGGLLLLLGGWGGLGPLAAVVLIAFCLGAEVDLMGYLIARYFPLDIYGRVYGAMFVVFSVAAGLGPWLAGMWYDRFESYNGIFWIFAISLLMSVTLLATLGRYVYPPAVEEP